MSRDEARQQLEAAIIAYGNHQQRWRAWPSIQAAITAFEQIGSATVKRAVLIDLRARFADMDFGEEIPEINRILETEFDSGNQATHEHSDTPRRSAARK